MQTGGATNALRPDSRSNSPQLRLPAHHGRQISIPGARRTARVDVRRLDTKFGAMLLQFTRIAEAVLVRKDGLVVEPVVGAFGAALRTSPAWQYATDPAAYFASYSAPEDEDEPNA